MKRFLTSTVALGLVLAAVTAHAQVATTRSGGRGGAARPPVELAAHYGYAWTFSQGTSVWNGSTYVPGDIDVEDSGTWGASLDYPVRPGTWAEFSYGHQTSDLTFKDRINGKRTLAELSINYWQIGAVQALKAGRVVPFTSLSLGGTYVTAEAVDESKWYFSAILGVGAKIYASEKVGLRLQARLPVSFTGGGLGFGLGTGGASAGFYGTGVTQFDLSAGAFVRF